MAHLVLLAVLLVNILLVILFILATIAVLLVLLVLLPVFLVLFVLLVLPAPPLELERGTLALEATVAHVPGKAERAACSKQGQTCILATSEKPC